MRHTVVVIVTLVALTVISLQLQCMRIRDIGWDPVCVMPGWFAGCSIGPVSYVCPGPKNTRLSAGS